MKNYQEPLRSAVDSRIKRLYLYAGAQFLVLIPVYIIMFIFMPPTNNGTEPSYDDIIKLEARLKFPNIIFGMIGFLNAFIYLSQKGLHYNEGKDSKTTKDIALSLLKL